MVKQDSAVHRLTNLVFALQDAARRGGRLLTPDWIRTNVDGYHRGNRDAFTQRLNRDIATLGRVGVPVIQERSADGTVMISLNYDAYELPEVSFTPEEAAVLGLAGEIGQTSELGVFARSGWTKLAASGVTRDLSQAPVFTAVNDTHRISSDVLRPILTIIREGLRMSFDYLPTPTAEAERRVMDPWGLVQYQDRLFLVGHDIDRDAPRVFRLVRVSDVRGVKARSTHESPGNLQDLVVAALSTFRERIDAVLTIPEGRAHELLAAGNRREDGKVVLLDVDRDWLARTAAGFAPDVVVEEPADVRAQIRDLLQGASR